MLRFWNFNQEAQEELWKEIFLVTGKVMEKILLKGISKPMRDRVTGSSQHGFTKGKSSLMNLIVFYDERNCLVNKENASDTVYFSKAFDVVSCNILTDKLAKYRLDKRKIRWIENWLNSWAQRIVISGAKPSWRQVTSNVPQKLIVGMTQSCET